MSLVPAAVAAGLTLEPAQLELKAANGSEIRVLGTVKLLMRVGESSLPLECMVVNNVSEILIGLTWLNEFAESWDFRHEVIVLGGSQHKLHGPPRTLKSRRVEVAGTTTVPARSEVNLVARVIFGDLALYDSDWVTRPAQMPGKLMVARTLVANQGSTVVVRVLNHTDKEVVLDVGTPICDLEEIPTMPALEEELSENEQDPIKLLLQAVDSSVFGCLMMAPRHLPVVYTRRAARKPAPEDGMSTSSDEEFEVRRRPSARVDLSSAVGRIPRSSKSGGNGEAEDNSSQLLSDETTAQ